MQGVRKTIFLSIGIITCVLYAYLAYASHISQEIRDKNINDLLKSNAKQEEMLKPFLEKAKTRYPNESEVESLKKLQSDLKKVEQKAEKAEKKAVIIEKYIALLEEKTRDTVFISSELNQIGRTSDGKYQTTNRLIPVGDRVIPIFSVRCESENKSKIIKMKVIGKGLPSQSDFAKSKHGRFVFQKWRQVEPTNIEIIVITDNQPKIHCKIVPYMDL